MAVKTMAKNTGTGQYNAGWHELTIKDAVDGTWTADTVERLKRNVEKRHTKKTTANSGDLGTVSVETTTNSTADIPF